VSENKLCSIFVVNAIKNFLRYDKRDGSVHYSEIMLNRIISLVVCVCCFFLCNCLYRVHISVCCLSSTEYSVNKDYY